MLLSQMHYTSKNIFIKTGLPSLKITQGITKCLNHDRRLQRVDTVQLRLLNHAIEETT